MSDIGMNVGVKFNVDDSEIKGSMNGLANDIKNASSFSPIQPSYTPPLINPDFSLNIQQQNFEKIRGVNEGLDKQRDTIQKTTDNLSLFDRTIARVKDTFENLFGLKKEPKSNLPTIQDDKELSGNGIKAIANLERQVPAQMSQAVTGNVMGAINGAVNTGASLITSLASEMSTGALLAATGIGAVAIGAMQVGAKAEQEYENALQGIDSIISAFGNNPSLNSAKGNALYGLGLRNQMLSFNVDTGMSNNEFIAQSAKFNTFGITDANLSAKYTQQAAQLARYTNGDVSQIANFMGITSRYGNSRNVSGDLEYLYGASQAAGLERNQFPEFLQGVEKIIEDGIAKGYTKSTKEVADTLVMFNKLSGDNEFWKGEQGANRLSQINNGLASATSLSSTSDLIAYQALRGKGEEVVKDGGFINDLIYMEQGLTTENFDSLANQIQSTYGNDVQSQVKAWKDISGLNYTGAAQLYNMAQNGASKKEIEETIEALKQDTNMQSDTTRLANSVANIEKSMVNIGKETFNVKMAGLETVEGFLGIMAGDSMENAKKKLSKSAVEGLFTTKTENNKKSEFKDTFEELWDGANATEKSQLVQVLSAYENMSEAEKNYFNFHDLEGSINSDSVEKYYSSSMAAMKAAKEGTSGNSYGLLVQSNPSKALIDASNESNSTIDERFNQYHSKGYRMTHDKATKNDSMGLLIEGNYNFPQATDVTLSVLQDLFQEGFGALELAGPGAVSKGYGLADAIIKDEKYTDSQALMELIELLKEYAEDNKSNRSVFVKLESVIEDLQQKGVVLYK